MAVNALEYNGFDRSVSHGTLREEPVLWIGQAVQSE